MRVKFSKLLNLEDPVIEAWEFHLPEFKYPTMHVRDKELYTRLSGLRSKQLEFGRNFNLITIQIDDEVGVFLFDKATNSILDFAREKEDIF